MKFRNLEIYDDYGSVDSNLIAGFENEFNIRLPKIYIDLITNHNAPFIKEGCFDYDNLTDEYGTSCFGFKGFLTNNIEQPENIYAQYIYDDLEYGYPHIYSFGSSANGDWICFDYREDPTTDEPKICIVIHDEYDEETGKHLLFPVANSFDEFLGMLYDFNEKYPL